MAPPCVRRACPSRTRVARSRRAVIGETPNCSSTAPTVTLRRSRSTSRMSLRRSSGTRPRSTGSALMSQASVAPIRPQAKSRHTPDFRAHTHRARLLLERGCTEGAHTHYSRRDVEVKRQTRTRMFMRNQDHANPLQTSMGKDGVLVPEPGCPVGVPAQARRVGARRACFRTWFSPPPASSALSRRRLRPCFWSLCTRSVGAYAGRS